MCTIAKRPKQSLGIITANFPGETGVSLKASGAIYIGSVKKFKSSSECWGLKLVPQPMMR